MKKSVSIIGVGKTGAEIALQIIKQNLLKNTELTIASVDAEYLNEFIIQRREEYPSFTVFQFLKQFEGEVTSDKIRFINSVYNENTDCVIVCADLEEEHARKFAPLIALDATLRGKYVISVFSSPDFKCEDSRMQYKSQLILGSQKTIEQNNDVLREVSEPKYSDPYFNLIEGFRVLLETNRPIKSWAIGPKGAKPLIEIKGHHFHPMTNEQRIRNFDSIANSIDFDLS